MIRGVIFDKDGTLFDFRRSWSGWALRVLEALSDDPACRADLAAAIGFLPETLDFHPDSPVIAGTAPEVAEAMLPHLPGNDVSTVIARINQAAAGAEMQEAVPLRALLEDLRARGLRIGLATNDTEAPAEAHLAAHGVRDLFDFVAGYDSGHGFKPGPGQLLAFLAATGLRPAEVAMVGDSLHDLEAGRAAGMARVAVLTGIAMAADLEHHADVVLPDIGHLPDWLDRYRGGQAS